MNWHPTQPADLADADRSALALDALGVSPGPWTRADGQWVVDANGVPIAQVMHGRSMERTRANLELLAGSRAVVEAAMAACRTLRAAERIARGNGSPHVADVLASHTDALLAAIARCGSRDFFTSRSI